MKLIKLSINKSANQSFKRLMSIGHLFIYLRVGMKNPGPKKTKDPHLKTHL